MCIPTNNFQMYRDSQVFWKWASTRYQAIFLFPCNLGTKLIPPPPLTAAPNQRSYLTTTQRHMWTSWSNYLDVSKASRLLTVSGFVETHTHQLQIPQVETPQLLQPNQASLWSQQTSFRYEHQVDSSRNSSPDGCGRPFSTGTEGTTKWWKETYKWRVYSKTADECNR